MKTWTEWIGVKEPNDTLSLPINKHQYEQIQLDAMKEGMRRAADTHCAALARLASEEGWPHTYHDAINLQKNILTAAEQLTEKDFCSSQIRSRRLTQRSAARRR